MKTTPRSLRAAKAKLPRAQYIKPGRLPVMLASRHHRAIVDLDTAAEARAFVAFWNLSEGEMVERVARLLCEQAIRSLDSWGTVAVENQVDSGWSEYEAKARAVLALFSAPASRRQRSNRL